jgi:hypothetical protein
MASWGREADTALAGTGSITISTGAVTCCT